MLRMEFEINNQSLSTYQHFSSTSKVIRLDTLLSFIAEFLCGSSSL